MPKAMLVKCQSRICGFPRERLQKAGEGSAEASWRRQGLKCCLKAKDLREPMKTSLEVVKQVGCVCRGCGVKPFGTMAQAGFLALTE